MRAFLGALAERRRLSASSQTQALSALLFLYREVLGRDLSDAGDIVRAKQPSRLPWCSLGRRFGCCWAGWREARGWPEC